MWNRSIDMVSKRLCNHFGTLDRGCEVEELLELPESLRRVIGNNFRGSSAEDIDKIIQLCWGIYSNSRNSEKFELVTTAPNEYKIMNRKTSLVLEEMIDSAKNSILITGYSISKFTDDLLEKILDKSRKGVKVSFYVNDLEKHQRVMEKLVLFKGRFLEIYNFKDEEDKMRALHAKVVLVDKEKGLISSSNLSYHGMIHNIEMGIAFTSKEKGEKIVNFFNVLTKKHVITRI